MYAADYIIDTCHLFIYLYINSMEINAKSVRLFFSIDSVDMKMNMGWCRDRSMFIDFVHLVPDLSSIYGFCPHFLKYYTHVGPSVCIYLITLFYGKYINLKKEGDS
jgi:hypothetical protein